MSIFVVCACWLWPAFSLQRLMAELAIDVYHSGIAGHPYPLFLFVKLGQGICPRPRRTALRGDIGSGRPSLR